MSFTSPSKSKAHHEFLAFRHRAVSQYSKPCSQGFGADLFGNGTLDRSGVISESKLAEGAIFLSFSGKMGDPYRKRDHTWVRKIEEDLKSRVHSWVSFHALQ